MLSLAAIHAASATGKWRPGRWQGGDGEVWRGEVWRCGGHRRGEQTAEIRSLTLCLSSEAYIFKTPMKVTKPRAIHTRYYVSQHGPWRLQKRRCHPGSSTPCHTAALGGATIPDCHARYSGTGQGQRRSATAHGHCWRGASRIARGSVGPAAIGCSGCGSCFSQHSPLVWLWTS